MIIAHSGTPGSGKSYDAIVRIIANLKKGRIVYTNIEGLEPDSACREMFRHMSGLDDVDFNNRLKFLNESELSNVWNIQESALIVLDELQNYFSNRDWQTTGNKAFNRWASVHRHKGQDLIVISQSIEGLDAQLRRMIEWTYDYRKINFLGSMVSNSFISYIYPQDNITGKYLDKKTSRYDRRIFACYKSYISKDISELKIIKSTNILKHPVFYILPLVIAGALYMFFTKSSFATGHIFGGSPMPGHVVSAKTEKQVNIKSVELSKSEINEINTAMFKGYSVVPNVASAKKVSVLSDVSDNISAKIVYGKIVDGNKIELTENGVVVGKMILHEVEMEKIPHLEKIVPVNYYVDEMGKYSKFLSKEREKDKIRSFNKMTLQELKDFQEKY